MSTKEKLIRSALYLSMAGILITASVFIPGEHVLVIGAGVMIFCTIFVWSAC